MLKVLFVLSLLLLISGSVQSQAGNTLVGTWKLVSVSSSTANGERNSVPYGARPTGILIYTREGTMAVVISYGERKSLSVVDRAIAPMKEKAEAFATFFAYSGRYGIVGDKVTHHVEVASVQNWVNTDQVRIIKYSGDRITLTTPPRLLNGRQQTFELVWQRLK